MKILMVAYRFPPAIGGLETHVRLLGRELVRRGHDVDVYTTTSLTYRDTRFLAKRPRLKKTEMIDGVNVERFPVWFRYWSLNIIPQMFGRMRTSIGQVDIVHAHVYHHISSVVACHYASKHARPFVLTAHNLVLPPRMPRRVHAFKRLYDHTFGRFLLDRSTALIAVAEHQVEEYVARGAGRTKVTIIPNPVDLGAAQADSQRLRATACDVAEGDRLLLFVGRVEPSKGVQEIIQMMPSILRHESAAKLVVVGPWEVDVQPLRDLARKLGVEDAVVIAGPKVGQELARLYRRADALVLPSAMESFGIVLLEAMAHGTLCIAYDSPGVRDVIRHGQTGILVQDRHELLGAILRHLGDGDSGESEKIRGRALSYVRRYSAAQVAEQTEELYDRALDQAAGV